MRKFERGDRVRVVPNLDVYPMGMGPGINEDMIALGKSGRVVKVYSVRKTRTGYRVIAGNWTYLPEWLQHDDELIFEGEV